MSLAFADDAPILVGGKPWEPQAGPQLSALQASWCDELFFGGARGGGKSDFLLGDYARDVPTYGPHWLGILFRESYPELEELVARGRQLFPPLFPGTRYHEQKRAFLFPNGAALKMRFLERDQDAGLYQGHQYAWIGWDELAKRASPAAYNELKACLRNGAIPILDKRIRSTGNPGGAGHQWCKSYFGIDRQPLGSVPIDDPETGMARMFIRSRVQDNKILMRNDPRYVARLRGVGSAELVKAWLEGDWDAIAGAFFDGWRTDMHVQRPFEIPADWLRFRSFDWGFAAPFSCGWWAVVSDNHHVPAGPDGRTVMLPRGALVRYREWYGVKMKPDGTREPNVGLRLTAEQVATGIKEREAAGEKIAYGVADPSMFRQDGGPSIAERMANKGVWFRRADNARVGRDGAMGGWDQMRARLLGTEGRPMAYCFSTCEDSIRTIPTLQHDKNNAEDLDTKGEDHAGDDWRYAFMSRPWIPPKKEKRASSHVFVGGGASQGGVAQIKSTLTVRQMIDRATKRRERGE